jgi:preprotein translocase subunit SecB
LLFCQTGVSQAGLSGDNITMSTTNGSPAPEAEATQMPDPQIGVLMQYVKDFSFENPNAPRGLTQTSEQPSIKINIGVEVAPLAENDVEVSLRVDGKAEVQGFVLFGFDLLYAGVFRILNVPPESLQPIIMIECPRLLFPFAREVVATAIRNGGFPPLMLEPVDFSTLYRDRMASA